MPHVRKKLSQLDENNWPRLHTAHGTAKDVPAALRALAGAKNTNQLLEAYWKLDNYIVLQGTLYESAYFATPYLLDILLSSHWPPVRVAAYDLLIEISCGVPDPHRLWNPPRNAPKDLREACRAIVACGLSAFEQDLYSANGAVRRRALDLLMSFDKELGDHLRILLSGIDPGEDVEFAGLLERAKGELGS